MTLASRFHAVYPSPRLVPGKVTALIDYLHCAFANADWPAALTQPGEASPPPKKQGKG